MEVFATIAEATLYPRRLPAVPPHPRRPQLPGDTHSCGVFVIRAILLTRTLSDLSFSPLTTPTPDLSLHPALRSRLFIPGDIIGNITNPLAANGNLLMMTALTNLMAKKRIRFIRVPAPIRTLHLRQLRQHRVMYITIFMTTSPPTSASAVTRCTGNGWRSHICTWITLRYAREQSWRSVFDGTSECKPYMVQRLRSTA
jgi:hypothetical protein